MGLGRAVRPVLLRGVTAPAIGRRASKAEQRDIDRPASFGG